MSTCGHSKEACNSARTVPGKFGNGRHTRAQQTTIAAARSDINHGQHADLYGPATQHGDSLRYACVSLLSILMGQNASAFWMLVHDLGKITTVYQDFNRN